MSLRDRYVSGTPWAPLSLDDRRELRPRVPDGYSLQTSGRGPYPPFRARLFDETRHVVDTKWGRTPREAAEALLAPDGCHWCGRDVSNGDFVNVQDGARVVRCCSVCWEKAE